MKISMDGFYKKIRRANALNWSILDSRKGVKVKDFPFSEFFSWLTTK